MPTGWSPAALCPLLARGPRPAPPARDTTPASVGRWVGAQPLESACPWSAEPRTRGRGCWLELLLEDVEVDTALGRTRNRLPAAGAEPQPQPGSARSLDVLPVPAGTSVLKTQAPVCHGAAGSHGGLPSCGRIGHETGWRAVRRDGPRSVVGLALSLRAHVCWAHSEQKTKAELTPVRPFTSFPRESLTISTQSVHMKAQVCFIAGRT